MASGRSAGLRCAGFGSKIDHDRVWAAGLRLPDSSTPIDKIPIRLKKRNDREPFGSINRKILLVNPGLIFLVDEALTLATVGNARFLAASPRAAGASPRRYRADA